MIKYINMKRICIRYYCTALKKNKLYSNTILLPQTKFPLRLENKKLVERDTAITESAAFKDLYSWQRENLNEPAFILHDGPPYANGAPHMGHVINKILKDSIVRYKILQGQKVDYVPGWDCHGLPIELKAIAGSKTPLTAAEIRLKARKFASETVKNQRSAFESWGVIGDWKHAYKTYNTSYIKNQMKQFFKLYNNNLVYRDIKPVYWSPSSRTALAEAELEYNAQHKSTAATVRLKIAHLPEQLVSFDISRVYALIWTTTPWSLPSNQAVCFNESLLYSFVRKSNDANVYIVAADLVDSLSKTLQTEMKILETFSGSLLKEVIYKHPIYEDELPFLHSEHARASIGTGLVHTAPAHGPDDFLVALSHKIPIKSMVDEKGCFSSEAGPNLEGLFVLNAGTKAVLEALKDDLINSQEYIHSYPYDWRTKKPVILLASKQWFINTDAIKNRAVELLEDVQVLPKLRSEVYKSNLMNQLKKRPYWCISRQRSWGVPIPVFYQKSTGFPVINNDLIQHLCTLLETHGSDYWWNLSLEELIPAKILQDLNVRLEDVEKGQDIFDIWFDSGISWSSVLGDEKIADVYLEGVDQFTGWFQSSLLTSVALRDKAPYKMLYVHGFAVDEKGMKMSKSLGNVVDPVHILRGGKGKKALGIDALRWWVVGHANQEATAHITPNVLQESANEVQKIRGVLRFALSALSDYTEADFKYSSLNLIDKYMLHLIHNFSNQVDFHIKQYQFNKICTTALNFLTNQASALYYTAIKDRLYCEASKSETRTAAQFVLLQLFHAASRSIAPIVPHLAEELHQHLPQKRTNSFFQFAYKVDEIWNNPKIEQIMEVLLDIKKDVHKIGASTSSKVHIRVTNEVLLSLQDVLGDQDLKALERELCDVYQVAEVILEESRDLLQKQYDVSVSTSNFALCNRCRRFSSDKEDKLCDRCNDVVELDNSDNKKQFNI